MPMHVSSGHNLVWVVWAYLNIYSLEKFRIYYVHRIFIRLYSVEILKSISYISTSFVCQVYMDIGVFCGTYVMGNNLQYLGRCLP